MMWREILTSNMLFYTLYIGLIASFFLNLYNRIMTGKLIDLSIFGRWAVYNFCGDFVLHNIKELPPVNHEKIFGWGVHIVVSFIYSFIYLLAIPLFTQQGMLSPWIQLVVALIETWVLLCLPFYIVYPMMGFGNFAVNAPYPWRIRFKSFMAHTVFGVGLWLGYLTAQFLFLVVAMLF